MLERLEELSTRVPEKLESKETTPELGRDTLEKGWCAMKNALSELEGLAELLQTTGNTEKLKACQDLIDFVTMGLGLIETRMGDMREAA